MEDQTKLFEDKNIKTINIDEEMKNSFLEYAMSVIVSRALPDVRDGLKPVHRRILFAMYNAGYLPNKPHKKCARIVGDVLGRYHPHGDSSVYDALVRMAQDFSLRYPLIDGQGNYGSIDGDNAAAMRYTEAKMAKISTSILDDIEKDTVDFMPNFDESLEEPKVLPSRLPLLLLNGTNGIAVGMATNIPPHNLSEVVDGLCAMIDNPDVDILELMQYIKAPDFPTSAIICGTEGVERAYLTGRGSVLIRSRTHVEELKKKGNKVAIIVTELPYQVNKANLIIKIAELVNDKKITGISDLRDESDRKGMRIFIELKRDAIPEIVLNQLYKHTQLQSSFGINMVALVNGVPKTLNLKQILFHYIEHRKTVIIRRTEFDLRKAKDRLHIIEGLRIALQNIDAIIELIKSSANAEEAKQGLLTKYNLSEKQATAILEMRLQRLTGLERDKLENEYQNLLDVIKDLQGILDSKERIDGIIKSEHIEIRDKYKSPRRSEIGESVESVDIEDLIPNEKVAVLLSKKGFVKRMPVTNFRRQLRGGRGVSGMTVRDEDLIEQFFVTNTHDYLLLFSDRGRVFKIKVYQVPEASRQGKGVSVSHFLHLDESEKITTLIPVETFNTKNYLFMATQKGVVKKTAIEAFSYFKNKPIIAINLDDNDRLRWVKVSTGEQDAVLVTSAGMVIRFSEEQARPLGRASRGVRGIRIKPEDNLVSMDVIDTEEDDNRHLLIITRRGYGKNIRLREFKCQNRGGVGVKSLRFRKRIDDDCVTDASVVARENEMMIITKAGVLCRQKIGSIATQRREAQGVIIVKLDKKDEVIAMSQIIDEPEEEQAQ
jgi:DNA gyrase subunit A